MSSTADFPALAVLVFAPAAGAALAALARGRLRRAISMGFAGAVLALAFFLAFDAPPRETHRWIPSLGLSLDLALDGLGPLLTVWIAVLALLALLVTPSESGPRPTVLVLLVECSLLGLAAASDGAAFIAFFGVGLLAIALFGGRSREMMAFSISQSAALFLALAVVTLVYHLARVQTGFPSADVARSSALVLYPAERARMFLLGAGAFALAAPLFPFAWWVSGVASSLPTPGKLLLFGGWSLVPGLFLARFLGAGEHAAPVVAVAVGSLLYAGLASRRSWAALLVGCQGLTVLGLLSGTAAGRAGMLLTPLALAAVVLWIDERGETAGAIPGSIALVPFLAPAGLILGERFRESPATSALALLGVALMLFHLRRILPPLSLRRGALVLPIVCLWALTLLSPSPFVPSGPNPAVAEEEE
jgi:NADH:ubiquinone oxidoreductase subunit 4 (subunit M)